MKTAEMNQLAVAMIAFACIFATYAMPTKTELAQAQQLVQDLTAEDLRAMKAGTKKPGEVAATQLALAGEAETEAGKYLLLQGAFKLYARAADYDAAADVLARMRKEIVDLPPEVVVELVNTEMRRVAAEKAPKVLAIFRDAQRTMKCRKELAAAESAAQAKPDDKTAQRRLAECHVGMGDWPKALEIFAKIGDEAAKFEQDPASAKGFDAMKAANYWWEYAAKDAEPFKAHAAALYKKGLDDGSITGLRKTLAEKRVKEMEDVLAASSAAARESAAPAASASTLEDQPKTKTLDLGGGVTIEMIYVAPGSFIMGADNEIRNKDGTPTQKPAHRVTLTKGYWLGKYEVTQKQWRHMMGSTPSTFKGDDLPVDGVSWEDCQVFIGKINKKLGGNNARLPTEAEWEYACRAGTDGDFAGTGRLDDMGWYKENSRDKTHPVGQKPANDWGFHDMHGNVWEWCNDRLGPYSRGDVSDPTGPSAGTYRVFRGGGYNDPMHYCPSTYRWREKPSYADGASGFRLCLSAGSDVPQAHAIVRRSTKPAASVNATVRPRTKRLDLGGGVKMEMVFVAPGTFMMGGDNGKESQRPAHKVTLTKGYWLGKYEVTQKQWRHVMGSVPSKFKGDDLPVDGVSWNECQRFIGKINRNLGGNRVRLPTEAEWEYACRAGTDGDFSGTGRLYDMGWDKENSSNKTHPVGQKQANAWGLYDMHGNVWEWCNDWWGDYPQEDVSDPVGAALGTERVFRGGSWGSPMKWCLSTYRWKAKPSGADEYAGFRLCMTDEGGTTGK